MIHLHTVAEMAKNLAKKHYSSVELTKHFIKRIKRYDTKLNSFITLIEPEALRQAEQADQKRSAGDTQPLTGIPFAHKDIFCTKNIKTTCGSRMLANFVSPYDATVVKYGKKAGLVTLGKTNMDEFAMGSSNENSYYGPVKNPWNIDCVPGGSSGGSAAAVAARLVPAASGSDTGGSVRQPAGLCNLTGIKPTYGRVSRYGMIAYASSLDQAGILGLNAEDVALLLSAIAGHDIHDSTSVEVPIPHYHQKLSQDLSTLTIGIPKEYFTQQLNPLVAQKIDEAIAIYRQLNVNFVEISLPHIHLSVPAYYIVAPAECSSNLARFDGIRYGYHCENPLNLSDLYLRSRSEGFGPEVKRRIITGTYTLSSGYYDAYYLKAQKVRQLIRQDFLNAFKEVDAILAPVTPEPAFKLGEKVDDPIKMYLSDIYTIPVNLAGLPAISLPVGFINNLPIGMQIIGPDFTEDRLLAFVHQYQQKTNWHQMVPEGFSL